MFTTWFLIRAFLSWFYRYMYVCFARHLVSFYHSLCNFLILLDLHVQILEFELRWTPPPKAKLTLWSRLRPGSFLSSLPCLDCEISSKLMSILCIVHIVYILHLCLQVMLIVKNVRELLYSLGLTGRVYEQECDERALMYYFKNKDWCWSFFVEKKMGE